MKKQIIKIITPKGATEPTELGLVELTKYLCDKGKGESSFGLGGKYGYGIEYENDIFMMHPFCWCEQEDCDWCNGVKPNFTYKQTNCEIRFYKYIGRDQQQKGKLPKGWLDVCKNSVK